MRSSGAKSALLLRCSINTTSGTGSIDSAVQRREVNGSLTPVFLHVYHQLTVKSILKKSHLDSFSHLQEPVCNLHLATVMMKMHFLALLS